MPQGASAREIVAPALHILSCLCINIREQLLSRISSHHDDSASAKMSDEEKTSYNYRILAALDASINASKDFVIGKGWSPLVQLGTSLEFLGN